MALIRISELLQTCSTDAPLFPPTELYNERWLLRLVVDWFAAQPRVAGDLLEEDTQPVAIQADALVNPTPKPMRALQLPEDGRWFSHARLPTPFGKRHKDDQLAEGRTEVDAALGHFDISGKTKLKLRPDAQHFVVLEAKMFSRLASGVKHAPYYDQGARTVACMAATLQRANRYPGDVRQLGFFVIAPQLQLDRGIFAQYLNRESIRQKVKQRLRAYDDKKRKQWYTEWFEPTLNQVAIDRVSWEAIIAYIAAREAEAAAFIEAFYNQCVVYSA